MPDTVRVSREGSAVTITIDREERRNALNESVATGIANALDEAEADRSAAPTLNRE